MKLTFKWIRLMIISIIPILIVSLFNLYKQTFFSSTFLRKGFIDDNPALFLLSFGFIMLPILLNFFSKLKKTFDKTAENKNSLSFNFIDLIEFILILLISLIVNHLWVSSQLNNNVISWITYNGTIPYLFQTVESFNIPGLFYWIFCVIYWFMYFRIFVIFLKLFVKIGNIKRLFSKGNTSFTQEFSKVDLKHFLISSTLFFAYTFCYYLILQISDFIVEGASTMDMHPNRLIVLSIVILLMLVYNLVTTIIHFYDSSSDENKQDIYAGFFQYEIKLDLVFAIAPGLIFLIYYLFTNYILTDEPLEFRNSLTFFVFLVIIAVSVINQLSKWRRISNYKIISSENSNLQIYAETVDKLFLSVSHYKHDITNTLLSFKTYIDEKKYDELETFYNEKIIANSPVNDSNYEFLTVISSINNMSLKGLLLYKFSTAEHLDINVNLEVIDVAEDLSINDVLLCRVIGILLDNAIEASVLSEQMKILFSMSFEKNKFVITVGNSYRGLPEINSIFKFNNTSKGKHRGIGLHSLSTILKSHTNIELDTSITKEWFLQRLFFDL